jgi:TrmH family RNA methyltransferase
LVSKSQIKLISSLQQKKYRDKHGLFVAEGPKIIGELIQASYKIHSLFSVEDLGIDSIPYVEIEQSELQRISFLKAANTALAVFHKPENQELADHGVIVALDAIRDPGNLGTIIRLCDWFGIEHMICSMDTADCYNPKVIQAAMGSTARVHVEYLELDKFLEESNMAVYGGCLEGTSVYDEEFPGDMIIVLGNEANGISKSVLEHLSNRVTIPQFGSLRETESLNVATAAAILLNEIRRKHK